MIKNLSLFEKYFHEKGEFTDLELTLSRIDTAISDFPLENDTTRVVHIAGTNGKGSTSFFISQMLVNEGKTTILFTSPHIISIRERIKINNTPVTEERFDNLFILSLQAVKKYRLSYFETLFLMCWILSKDIKPDYLILETGLGGRFDATNTGCIPTKTPVITTIAQDHQNLLGKNIYGILMEKLAIIQGNNPVFVGFNQPFIIDKIKEIMPDKEIIEIDSNQIQTAKKLYPSPFHYNFLLAHRVSEYLLNMPISMRELMLPPCRQEKFGRIIIDGAHNISGLLTLINSFDQMPDAAIVSATRDRDINKFCGLLSHHIKNIVLTTIPDNQRSYTVTELKNTGYPVYERPEDGLNDILKKYNGNILVLGSLYLCAYLRHIILEQRG